MVDAVLKTGNTERNASFLEPFRFSQHKNLRFSAILASLSYPEVGIHAEVSLRWAFYSLFFMKQILQA